MKRILETERLYLRNMSMDDYEVLHAVLADPEIMQHYPYSFDETRVKVPVDGVSGPLLCLKIKDKACLF